MSGDHNMHCIGNQTDLVERIRQSEREAWRYTDELEQDRKRLEKELAESQAREAKLRGVLQIAVDYARDYEDQPFSLGEEVLSIPNDDTALKEMLKVEYQRGLDAGIDSGWSDSAEAEEV